MQVTTFTYSIDENGGVGFQRRDFHGQQHDAVARPQAAPPPNTAPPAGTTPAPELFPATSAASAAGLAHTSQQAPAQPPEATGDPVAPEAAQHPPDISAPNPGVREAEEADAGPTQDPTAPVGLTGPSPAPDEEASAPAGLPDEPSAVSIPPVDE